MAYRDKTMIRAAAMQRDRDADMSVAEIAEKYRVSKVTVYTYTCSNKPMTTKPSEKASRQRNFASRWNEVRYAILLGLRTSWIDEWNAARFKLLGVKE